MEHGSRFDATKSSLWELQRGQTKFCERQSNSTRFHCGEYVCATEKNASRDARDWKKEASRCGRTFFGTGSPSAGKTKQWTKTVADANASLSSIAREREEDFSTINRCRQASGFGFVRGEKLPVPVRVLKSIQQSSIVQVYDV